MTKKNYKSLLHQISTFVFDIDGVFTDATAQITITGELLRKLNLRDTYAVNAALEKGYDIVIISRGVNEGIRLLFSSFGIKYIYTKSKDKQASLKDYLIAHDTLPENILYMGDDIPDIEVMQMAGLACCPQDAMAEVKNISDYISHLDGGKGCVRDVIRQVMIVKGDW